MDIHAEPTPRRRRGRPAGQFERNRDHLLVRLAAGTQHHAPDELLADDMTCDARQVRRYLSSLREAGYLETAVIRTKLPDGWVTHRAITVTPAGMQHVVELRDRPR